MAFSQRGPSLSLNAGKRGQFSRGGVAHIFHVVVDSVKDRALVDDEHGEVLHDVGQVRDGLQNVADLFVSLLRKAVHVVDPQRLQFKSCLFVASLDGYHLPLE